MDGDAEGLPHVILVLGGTIDGRTVAAELGAAGHAVRLSVVSEYGARLAASEGVEVWSGALDAEQLERLAADASAVVDATHPFAQEISRNAVAACSRCGTPYLRYERAAGELPEGVLTASDAAEAARLAVDAARTADERPTVLLTVGSKSVHVYAEAARAAGVRLVARVLPVPESLSSCAAAGLEPRDIVAMQGPTSAELDAALLRHLGAQVLVTKESGAAGGFAEKLRAAQLTGAVAVVVRRPAEGSPPGSAAPAAAERREPTSAFVATTPSEVFSWLAGLDVGGRVVASLALDGAAPRAGSSTQPRRRGLLQVYTGDGKGKTTAAVGLALRARGAGHAVSFLQFIKGGEESSELAPLRAAGVAVVRPASAGTGLLRSGPTAADCSAAEAAWAAASAALADPSLDLVVLDELHAALRCSLVDEHEVLAALAARPSHQEVVTTGRGASEGLCAAADLITEMVPVRHPYPAVPARRGVEL